VAVNCGGPWLGIRFGELGWASGGGELAAGACGRWVSESPVAAHELFSSTEVLGRMVMEKMLAGVSTRRNPAGLGAGCPAGD
jgi:hypothetical protein